MTLAGTAGGTASGAATTSSASGTDGAEDMDADDGGRLPSADLAMSSGDESGSGVDSDLQGLPVASAKAAAAERAGKRGGKGRQGKGDSITHEGVEAQKLGLAFDRVLGKASLKGVMEVRCAPIPHCAAARSRATRVARLPAAELLD